MVHLLRTTAVSLAPPATDVDRLSDLALAVSEAAVELLRLDGVSRVNMRIDERPHEMKTALTVAASVPESWVHSWHRSISALVLIPMAIDPSRLTPVPLSPGSSLLSPIRLSPDSAPLTPHWS